MQIKVSFVDAKILQRSILRGGVLDRAVEDLHRFAMLALFRVHYLVLALFRDHPFTEDYWNDITR